MNSFREGKETGFNHFFHSYYQSLCFFASKYIRDPAAAVDIVEDSFIKVWEKREQMGTETGLRGYLYKAVYNGCLKEIRRHLRQ